MAVTTDDLKYLMGFEESENVANRRIEQIMSTTLNGIEGLPYQFLDTVDRRITPTDVGRKYAEKIFNRLPLLFIAPCEPLFMDQFSDEEKSGVTDLLIQSILDRDVAMKATVLDTILGNTSNGRYYSVDFAYADYYLYLNTMLTCLATYMGLADVPIKISGDSQERRLADISWQNEANESFKSFFSAKENLIFYLDGFDSVSESLSNDTTESSLASLINGKSDQMNEIRFLFGGGSGADNAVSSLLETGSDSLTSLGSTISSTLGLTNATGGLIESLSSKGLNAALHGGKIIFPEIWSNSDFSRSYSLDIKLRSPDHDNLSIFLNVLKPYCKILALTLPRETVYEKGGVFGRIFDHNGADPNSYNSPFLVRAYSKGKFNIDMGIITSISVHKGSTACWNDDGLPTQLDISIEIKDLYSKMSMSKAGINNIKDCVNNTSYQDFLANMAGLNIGQMEMGRKITMAFYLCRASLFRIPSNIFTKWEQDASRLVHRIYRTI